jgi:probable rRNA maturation factor
MITLEIANEFLSLVETQIIEDAVKVTLQQHPSAPFEADLTIVITDDQTIQQLNRDYREINAPTDVLSFPADFNDPESEAPYLGDVLISNPQAKDQAGAGGHSVNAELQLLAVHGVLHLLGYDHAIPRDKTQMWSIQTEILAKLGIEDIQISE